MYGNINIGVLNLIHNKKMMKGLPLINCVDQFCEGCVMDKHHRDSFPVGKSLRETKPLELVHAYM
jgi:hypothetical protein